MGFWSALGNVVSSGLDAVSGVVSHPIIAITKGPEAAIDKFVSQTPVQRAISTSVSVGSALGVVAPVAVLAGSSSALAAAITGIEGKVITTAITHPIKTGAVVAGTTLVAESKKLSEAVQTAPSASSNFISNVATTIDNPSLENVKKIFVENPLIASGVALAGGVVGVKTATSIANLVATERNTKAIENALDKSGSAVAPTTLSSMPLTMPTTLPTNQEKPYTQETTTISTGTKKRKRKAKKAETPSINIKIDDRDIYYVGKSKAKSIKRRTH